MKRDPNIAAEAHALRAALGRHRLLDGLRSSPEWASLGPRLAAMLAGVRLHVPDAPPPESREPERIRVAHWNVEHGNRYTGIEAALTGNPDLLQADVVLLNEIDVGMARSGNRDVAHDLARARGLHAAWAPLFLETTLGRHDDTLDLKGQDNQESLFGLAILSRWPLSNVRVVELPSPERHQFEAEGMFGRHIALVTTVERPGAPFIAVSVHLEVHRTRVHRARQMRVLVDHLASERLPVLLAGDFNSHTFDRGRPWDPLSGAWILMTTDEHALERRFLYPDLGPARETLFDELRRGGFEWDRLADRRPTLQLRFDRIEEARVFPGFVRRPMLGALARAEQRGRLRLDWFAFRGWSGGLGHTVTGLDGRNGVSDHAPLVAEIW